VKILSTLLAIIVERSSEDAGEKADIGQKLYPYLSSGTKPDGVVFIRRKKSSAKQYNCTYNNPLF